MLALNWYRKASGLESEDIAFASTIETAVKAEYEDELNLLRNELDNRQEEIIKLQSQLERSRKNYNREQIKLNQLKTNLKKSSIQLENLKNAQNSSNNTSKINKYEKISQIDADKVRQQLKVVEQMKTSLSKNNSQLASKLKQAEQRSIQLSEDLIMHKQEEGLLKTQLITLETQLSTATLSITQLTDQLLSEQHLIDDEKKELDKLKKHLSTQHTTELGEVKTQLAIRNKELAERQQLIKKLEAEKAKVAIEKNDLTAGQSKTLQEKNQQLEMLNSQLLQQNQNLKKQRTKIALLEDEKKQAITSQKEHEKAQNKNLGINNERIQQLESQLALHEQTFNKQRSQILAMKKDKQKYELSIEQLKNEKKQKLAYAKPSIEILDPPFSITRSTNTPSIRLRSIMTHREITGRVIAPAGLLSFNINGISKEVNSSGIFKSQVELQGQKTLVRTVAIDRLGNKAILDFMLLPALHKATPAKYNRPNNTRLGTNINTGVNFGPYHALIIGNQKYKHFSNLYTPVNDAQTIDKILREKYGFQTTMILNANRYDILSALNKLRSKLTENDNLLIYYAGHGELDRINLRGHWLPIDAEADNTANWISTIAITDIINAMSAKHVLVVADSCYSGAMTRSSLARLEAGMSDTLRYKWLRLMSKTRSRTVLTSGGLKPVLDSGSNGHSIFANAFIEAISNNDKILEGQQLYRKVYDRLQKAIKKLNFKQEPQYAPIRHGGHEAGDFFLVSSN